MGVITVRKSKSKSSDSSAIKVVTKRKKVELAKLSKDEIEARSAGYDVFIRI